MQKTKKMVFLAMMISFSLVLYFVENMLPSLYFIAPGAKLGLSNIISVIVLYTLGFVSAFMVLMIRMLMASFFGGGFSSLLYSLGGGIFALIAMTVLHKTLIRWLSPIGVSVGGAVFFNIGQLLVAAIIIENMSLFVYLPVLIYVSIGTGIFVGFVSKMMLEKISFIHSLSDRRRNDP